MVVRHSILVKVACCTHSNSSGSLLEGGRGLALVNVGVALVQSFATRADHLLGSAKQVPFGLEVAIRQDAARMILRGDNRLTVMPSHLMRRGLRFVRGGLGVTFTIATGIGGRSHSHQGQGEQERVTHVVLQDGMSREEGCGGTATCTTLITNHRWRNP